MICIYVMYSKFFTSLFKPVVEGYVTASALIFISLKGFIFKEIKVLPIMKVLTITRLTKSKGFMFSSLTTHSTFSELTASLNDWVLISISLFILNAVAAFTRPTNRFMKFFNFMAFIAQLNHIYNYNKLTMVAQPLLP